jgi:hypothetical protein
MEALLLIVTAPRSSEPDVYIILAIIQLSCFVQCILVAGQCEAPHFVIWYNIPLFIPLRTSLRTDCRRFGRIRYSCLGQNLLWLEFSGRHGALWPRLPPRILDADNLILWSGYAAYRFTISI